MKIRIIADSASDMSSEEHENLTLIPMKIVFGETEYLDGVTLSQREFYEKLIASEELPTTSQATPYEFEKVIREAVEAGETPIVVTISSKLSGTYNSAKIAASEFEEEVYVVDSENVCIGERLLVEYALRMVDAGKSAAEIVQEMERAKKDIRLIALLDTLEYLRRGGRISNMTGIVGSMLSVKPIVAAQDGMIETIGKARGAKNANKLLTAKIEEAGEIDYDMPYAVAYSGLDSSMLEGYLADHEEVWKSHTDQLEFRIAGSAIGTHAGPGAIAVAFFNK